jgi:hypothetical protein
MELLILYSLLLNYLDSLVANYTNLTLQINKNIFRNISIGNSTSNILLATSNYTGYFEDVSDILVFPLYYSQMFHLALQWIYYSNFEERLSLMFHNSTAKSEDIFKTYPTFGRYMFV